MAKTVDEERQAIEDGLKPYLTKKSREVDDEVIEKLSTDQPEYTPLVEKLADELDAVQAESAEIQELVEPTDEEKRNGWTAETLTTYLTERRAGQALSIDQKSIQRRMARRPSEQNHRYRVLRWRE